MYHPSLLVSSLFFSPLLSLLSSLLFLSTLPLSRLLNHLYPSSPLPPPSLFLPFLSRLWHFLHLSFQLFASYLVLCSLASSCLSPSLFFSPLLISSLLSSSLLILFQFSSSLLSYSPLLLSSFCPISSHLFISCPLLSSSCLISFLLTTSLPFNLVVVLLEQLQVPWPSWWELEEKRLRAQRYWKIHTCLGN